MAKRGRTPIPLADRFWSKVDKCGECWTWTGCRTALGYGSILAEGERKWIYAHRVSWEIHNGRLPEPTGDRTRDICVLHRCDNPSCVRPEHLFLGTMKDNSRDMARKGRCRYVTMYGEKHPNSKLTWEAVRRIRELRATGVQAKVLATTYGVSDTLIRYVCSGAGWKEPKEELSGAE